MKKEEVYGHIDHTLLKAFSTTEQIEAIAEEALKYGTASICIPTSFVNYIHNKYKDVNICTVIGFPLGYSTTPIKVAEAKQAIEDGANEIDMVINIGWAKEHILYGLMEKMKSEGKSVIFISHDIDELMEKCDYLTVFRDGIYIDEVPKEKFNADLIKQLMVGREMVGAYYREDFKPSHEDEVVLSVEHITQGIVTDVSFDAYKGEILGIGGLNECGMHELGKLIFGLEPRTIGVTRYHGGVEFKNPTDAMKLGIGYISKDRDKEAILTAASIRDNI